MRTKSYGNVIFAVILLFCLCGAALLPVSAKEASRPAIPDVYAAKAAYLYNFESDRAIVSKNMNGRIAPSSTVKIASGLLAIEALDHRLDETITVMPNMLSTKEGARLGLKFGDILSVRDLLYASICGGYNDATDILAYLVSGSQEAFVNRLNGRVADWGCENTHYKNATGMDAVGMYTTLEDVVTISRRAMESSLYMTISSAISYSFPLQNTEKNVLIYNRNALIGPYYYQGCQSKYAKGLIAGMTDAGGYCVVTSAEYAGSHYLCIVMGATGLTQGIPNSFSLAYRLLQYAFLNCVYTPVAQAGDEICQTTVRLALPTEKEGVATVVCVLQDDLYALLPEDLDLSKDLSFRPYLHKEHLEAPVTAGSVVGGMDVYFGDTWLCHTKLIAAEDVESNTILTVLDGMKRAIFSRRTLLILLLFVAMMAIYLPVSAHRRRKNTVTLDFHKPYNKQPPKPPTR